MREPPAECGRLGNLAAESYIGRKHYKTRALSLYLPHCIAGVLKIHGAKSDQSQGQNILFKSLILYLV